MKLLRMPFFIKINFEFCFDSHFNTQPKQRVALISDDVGTYLCLMHLLHDSMMVIVWVFLQNKHKPHEYICAFAKNLNLKYDIFN